MDKTQLIDILRFIGALITLIAAALALNWK